MAGDKKPGCAGGAQSGFTETDTCNYPIESAARQRARLKAYLRLHGSVSTLEARRELDIMHPAGRVLELRQAGCEIRTVWVSATTSEGHRHRIARYLWQAEVRS